MIFKSNTSQSTLHIISEIETSHMSSSYQDINPPDQILTQEVVGNGRGCMSEMTIDPLNFKIAVNLQHIFKHCRPLETGSRWAINVFVFWEQGY